MQPLAVDLRLMRDVLLPDVKLAVGRSLMARVIDTGPGGRGALAIAGYKLSAELPENVQSGQELRLTVREITAHRVLLGITDPAADAAPAAQTVNRAPETPQPPPALAQAPLPDGGRLTVHEHASEPGSDGGGEPWHTLSMTYDAPEMGPVGLRFQYARGSVRLEVSVATGHAYAHASTEAEALRSALTAVLDQGASAAVRVVARREPFDAYA